MEEGLINQLHTIGTPVVIIAAAVIAISLRSISHKLSIAGGIITLVAVVAYIPIDLIPKLRGAWGDMKIEINPTKFVSLTSSLEPTGVTVLVKRGEQEILSKNILSPSKTVFANKKISLERVSQDELFIAKVGNLNIGVLTDQELKVNGFNQNVDTDNKTLQYIATSKRVYLGRSWFVTNTPLGKIKVSFKKLESGKAAIYLTSASFGIPQPERVLLLNKEFAVQSFDGNYEVTIKVSQADFNQKGKEWVQLTIVIV